MKLVNYIEQGHIRTGLKTEYGIVDIIQNAIEYNIDVPTSIEHLIESGNEGLFRLHRLLDNELIYKSESELDYAPCLCHPEKILCVGVNYRAHANEMGKALPEQPLIFGKFNNAIAAHNQEILLPKHAQQFDYEAELVIVIGKEAHEIPEEEAPAYIFGYTTGNDVSARDLQNQSSQWLIGKSCDGFAPIGPYLVTSDEINPDALAIRSYLNGELRQNSNTSDMIFHTSRIVSFISHQMTLKPGDLIFTGTPGGVIMGYPEDERVWIKSGDTVAIEIEGIGRLENTFF